MYIKDEHPMRSRIRYLSNGTSGIGIGPEVVIPVGQPIRLQQTTPPEEFDGLMAPLVDTYQTLHQPVMAPLPYYADFDNESMPPDYEILPVEISMETPMDLAVEDGLVEDPPPSMGRSMGTCLGCRRR